MNNIGRGRLENSIYVVLVLENSKILKREEGNWIWEVMMNWVIYKVWVELSIDEEVVFCWVWEI